jgi:hypothetical protein
MPLSVKICWTPSIRTHSLGMASNSPKQTLQMSGKRTNSSDRKENYKQLLEADLSRKIPEKEEQQQQ